MNDHGGRDLIGEARASYRLRGEAVRQSTSSATGNSPLALEATLASISAEVTQEAIERKQRSIKP